MERGLVGFGFVGGGMGVEGGLRWHCCVLRIERDLFGVVGVGEGGEVVRDGERCCFWKVETEPWMRRCGVE